MIEFFRQRILRGLIRHYNNWRIRKLSIRIARQAPLGTGQPVAFFKASTGIDDLSWNSGFHLLVTWAFRLQGVPVVIFACNSGMSRCILGTYRDDPGKGPPCRSCIHQSQILYSGLPNSVIGINPSGNPAQGEDQLKISGSRVHWFTFDREPELEHAIIRMSLDELIHFSFQGLPLGRLCAPGLRWILRRYHLNDDESSRYLMREYILSSWNVARKFSIFLDRTDPSTVVLFNGQFFPEAVARFVAKQRGLRVITHEAGLQPASAFFTDGEATAYPIRIPDEFELSAEQSARLDNYLQKRFQGQFSMAGIQFWPEIRGLDDSFMVKAQQFEQIVPVFTNVIFDTSQQHANTVFEDMFTWLDLVLEMIKSHPHTLFVIRAHPDESRLRKESRETVQNWVTANGVHHLQNVLFIPSGEHLSSYELIQRSKFVMVYNSTIGLEASIMGVPVLCSGKARFTQYPTVFFPLTVDEQRRMMKEFLEVESITIPPEHPRNARRFLYYQLFKTSLPFEDFLKPSVRTTQTRLKSFSLSDLIHSQAIKTITSGVLGGMDYFLDEDQAGKIQP